MVASVMKKVGRLHIRHLCLLVLVLLLPAFYFSAAGRNTAPDPSLDSIRSAALDRLVASRAIDPGNFALLITDLSTGETLVGYNVDRPLIPASIMKSLTIASLINKRDYRDSYSTEVFADGRIRNGVLEGNLIIEGSGDPSVNSAAEPKSPDFISEIVSALARKDIDSIAGRIIIDDSRYAGPSYPDSWGRGDLSASYGTGSHAFNFSNNASGKSAIQNISAHFISRLAASIKKEGIKLGDNEIREGRRHKLMVHKSPELAEIMRSCMMRSDNLFAECFLREFSVAVGGDGSTADGARREIDYWARRHAPMEGVRIIDGSGLSRSNRITPRFLTDVLTQMADNVEYVSFFPLAGQEGTLRRFMKDSRLDSYLAMKTGSMRGIQCYAGYLLDDDFAPTHTVVVMVNNMKADRSRLRSDLGDFFLSIF